MASEGEKIIGVLAISEHKWIRYFFVHPDFHRNGVAKSIWQRAAPALEPEVTVRSSVFAIPFYESLGFQKIGGIESFNGMSYQVMKAHY